jgi:hypothetical protein
MNMIGISFLELLRFDEQETDRWHQFLNKQGAGVLELPVDLAGGKTVRDLLLHIFGVELKYAERMSGGPLTQPAELPKRTLDEIFSIATTAQEKLKNYLKTASEAPERVNHLSHTFRGRADRQPAQGAGPRPLPQPAPLGAAQHRNAPPRLQARLAPRFLVYGCFAVATEARRHRGVSFLQEQAAWLITDAHDSPCLGDSVAGSTASAPSTPGANPNVAASRLAFTPHRMRRLHCPCPGRCIISRTMAPDHEPERQRLAKLYGEMSEGELRKVAADAAELTDMAHQALAEEIARRGFDIPLIDSVAVDELELRQLVTIGHFRDLPEALLAKGRLDSAGIECFLIDQNMVRMDWFISNLLGGIKLQVKKEDAEEALALLGEPDEPTGDASR